jgi:hypothetical protein
MAQAIIHRPRGAETRVRSCQSMRDWWWKEQALEHVCLKFKSPGVLLLACQTLKTKALQPTETSVTFYHSAPCSIPEDLYIAVACACVRTFKCLSCRYGHKVKEKTACCTFMAITLLELELVWLKSGNFSHVCTVWKLVTQYCVNTWTSIVLYYLNNSHAVLSKPQR